VPSRSVQPPRRITYNLKGAVPPRFELCDRTNDAYAFSNWSDYLDPEDPGSGRAQAKVAGARTVRLHTSGHASPLALAAFAEAIAPKTLVPVHGVAWDDPGIALPPVTRLTDGEAWTMP
jgi:ribonuclease J